MKASFDTCIAITCSSGSKGVAFGQCVEVTALHDKIPAFIPALHSVGLYISYQNKGKKGCPEETGQKLS